MVKTDPVRVFDLVAVFTLIALFVVALMINGGERYVAVAVIIIASAWGFIHAIAHYGPKALEMLYGEEGDQGDSDG